MLEVKGGKIFVEGVETINAELIGMAFLDFAEECTKRDLNWKPILPNPKIKDYED